MVSKKLGVPIPPEPTFYMEWKNLSTKWGPYILANFATHPWLTQKIHFQTLSVAADERPSLKLTLKEGGSRGNVGS